ncbi:uncharacterized protein [Apostichopus japonicus]|uniref:uncharacterized protein n=1 Tax=Stichopus japonicus TaxID=307972 RepID=UPI003AB6B5A4
MMPVSSFCLDFRIIPNNIFISSLFIIWLGSTVMVRGDLNLTENTCDGNTSVRLVGVSYRGRIEVCYAGVWGTVCDDGFRSIAGDVVCRQLGFRGAREVFTIGETYAPTEAKIWLDDVTCTGRESSIQQCMKSGLGRHNCNHHEDVGVECLDHGYCQTYNPCDSGALFCENVASSSFHCICQKGWKGETCEERDSGYNTTSVIIYIFCGVAFFIIVYVFWEKFKECFHKTPTSNRNAPVRQPTPHISSSVSLTILMENHPSSISGEAQNGLPLPTYEQLQLNDTATEWQHTSATHDTSHLSPPPSYDEAVTAMNASAQNINSMSIALGNNRNGDVANPDYDNNAFTHCNNSLHTATIGTSLTNDRRNGAPPTHVPDDDRGSPSTIRTIIGGQSASSPHGGDFTPVE